MKKVLFRRKTWKSGSDFSRGILLSSSHKCKRERSGEKRRRGNGGKGGKGGEIKSNDFMNNDLQSQVSFHEENNWNFFWLAWWTQAIADGLSFHSFAPKQCKNVNLRTFRINWVHKDIFIYCAFDVDMKCQAISIRNLINWQFFEFFFSTDTVCSISQFPCNQNDSSIFSFLQWTVDMPRNVIFFFSFCIWTWRGCVAHSWIGVRFG